MATTIANINEILDRRKIGGFQKLIIALCTTIMFVEGMNAQLAGYVAPDLREAWKLTPSELGTFFSSVLFGLMLGGLFVAPMADRIGRRPILVGCVALFGTCSGVALAMLANLEEWGGYCGRVAEALLTRYDLPEQAVGFFRFFAGPAPGFTEQATSVIAAGLAAAKMRRRRCGRPWPCTRTRSRSGTHSPTASTERPG